jgi:hypothetical protein
VELTHHRLEPTGTMDITLGNDDLEPGTAIGGDARRCDPADPADRREGRRRPRLRDQALANDFDDFERGKQNAVLNATLQVKDINDLILQKMLDEQDHRRLGSAGGPR